MKCPHCSKDCTYRERSGGSCPHCSRAFALEPRQGDVLSDYQFQAAVQAVSSQGTVYFTLDHLYYEVCRKAPQMGPAGCLGCLTMVATAFVGVKLGEYWADTWLTWLAILGPVGAGWMTYRALPKTKPLSRAVFNRIWSKWAGVHGVPARLIVAQSSKPKPTSEQDLGDYSFDRAIICDRNSTVDLLIANRFHFENNCAVLTADGYPSQVFATVKAMLNRNPRLKVWVLHDATVSGCLLAKRLHEDPNWFCPGVQIIDVGMRPGNCGSLEKLWLRGNYSVPKDPALSSKERQWLAHHSLELAAIRPEQVIKRLFRSLSAYDDQSGSGLIIDEASFSSDATSSDGGGDSFG